MKDLSFQIIRTFLFYFQIKLKMSEKKLKQIDEKLKRSKHELKKINKKYKKVQFFVKLLNVFGIYYKYDKSVRNYTRSNRIYFINMRISTPDDKKGNKFYNIKHIINEKHYIYLHPIYYSTLSEKYGKTLHSSKIVKDGKLGECFYIDNKNYIEEDLNNIAILTFLELIIYSFDFSHILTIKEYTNEKAKYRLSEIMDYGDYMYDAVEYYYSLKGIKKREKKRINNLKEERIKIIEYENLKNKIDYLEMALQNVSLETDVGGIEKIKAEVNKHIG